MQYEGTHSLSQCLARVIPSALPAAAWGLGGGVLRKAPPLGTGPLGLCWLSCL